MNIVNIPSPKRYEADEVFRVMLPYVNRVKEAGCRTIAECTPAYLGRDPKLLQRLSKATGVNFLTNTGYYGARQGKFLPSFAFRESADELAKRWTAEWKDGIESTDIRPGFIKIGVDAGELTDVNRKLVEAAARCHLETGLTIAGHTGDGKAALQQVDILKKAGVSPSAWIWVHAQNERNPEIHQQTAKAGGWVEFEAGDPSYPIWTGFFWNDGDIDSADTDPSIKFFRTKKALLRIDDSSGEIIIENTDGSTITLTSDEIVIKSATVKQEASGGKSTNLSSASFKANDGNLEVL